METLGINYESLKNNDFKAHIFFSALFNTIGKESFEKFYVEIFDLKEDGCVIYVSEIIDIKRKSHEKHKENSCCLTIQTKMPEKLPQFAKQLSGQDINVLKSVLYLQEGEYRLVLQLSEGIAPNFKKLVCESQMQLFSGRITASVTDEHWKKIIPEKAVETLSALS